MAEVMASEDDYHVTEKHEKRDENSYEIEVEVRFS